MLTIEHLFNLHKTMPNYFLSHFFFTLQVFMLVLNITSVAFESDQWWEEFFFINCAKWLTSKQ